jgi:hypothetical protein
MSDLKAANIAKGYLKFLQSLTESQQRFEIERMVFSKSQGLVADEILKHPTVAAFTKSLGFNAYWKFETQDHGMGAGEIGSPRFSDGVCFVPILFRYKNLNHFRGWTVSNLEYKLFVNGWVNIDDDGEPIIDHVSCWSNQAEVHAEKEALTDSQKNGYVNYLRMLTPLNRCNAIFDLAELKWGIDNPKFLIHPELSAAAMALGIAHLGYADLTVGPVEFEGERCKVPITCELCGFLHGKDELLAAKSIDDEVLDAKYFVQVQILASVSDTAPTGTSDIGCELSIENMWFSILPIDDYKWELAKMSRKRGQEGI